MHMVACITLFMATFTYGSDVLERVRRDYPAASERIETVYSRIKIVSFTEYSEHEQKHQGFSRDTFIRDKHMYYYASEMLGHPRMPDGFTTIYLLTDVHSLLARKENAKALPVIFRAEPIDERRRRFDLDSIYSSQKPAWINLYSVFAGAGFHPKIRDLLSGKVERSGHKVAVTNAFSRVDAGKEVIDIRCEDTGGFWCNVTLSPSDAWVVITSEIGSTHLPEYRIRYTFSYDGTFEGVPLVKTGSFFARQVFPRLQEGLTRTTVLLIDPGPVDPAVFTPEGAGLKYAAPLPRRAWWLWIALLLCLVLLVIGWRLRRRSRRWVRSDHPLPATQSP